MKMCGLSRLTLHLVPRRPLFQRVFKYFSVDMDTVDASNYKEYLEKKEEMAAKKPKALLDIPQLTAEKLARLVGNYKHFDLMDKQLFSAVEVEFRNRISGLEDEDFLELLKEMLKVGTPFADFRFVEKRILTAINQASKNIVIEFIPLINLIATGGQNTSVEFSIVVSEAFEPIFDDMDKEDRLVVARALLSMKNCNIEKFPKQWFNILADIKTTKEFILSVDVVSALVSREMTHLIPPSYSSKVVEFSMGKIGTITLFLKTIQALELLKIGNIGFPLKELIVFVKDELRNAFFKNVMQGVFFIGRTLEKHPQYFNSVASDLLALNTELLVFGAEICESMSLEEINGLLRGYLSNWRILKQSSPSDSDHLRAIFIEGIEKISSEMGPPIAIAFVHNLCDILETCPQHRAAFSKDPNFIEAVNSVFNMALMLRIKAFQHYFHLFRMLNKLLDLLKDSEHFEGLDRSMMIVGMAQKALTVKLTNYKDFVAAVSLIEESAEIVGKPHNVKLLTILEQLRDKYKPL